VGCPPQRSRCASVSLPLPRPCRGLHELCSVLRWHARAQSRRGAKGRAARGGGGDEEGDGGPDDDRDTASAGEGAATPPGKEGSRRRSKKRLPSFVKGGKRVRKGRAVAEAGHADEGGRGGEEGGIDEEEESGMINPEAATFAVAGAGEDDAGEGEGQPAEGAPDTVIEGAGAGGERVPDEGSAKGPFVVEKGDGSRGGGGGRGVPFLHAR